MTVMRQYLFMLLMLLAAMTAKAEMQAAPQTVMTDTLTQHLVGMPGKLTLRQLFIEMPDSLLPYISRNNRLDCIDFIDSNMAAIVTNSLGGKSEMTALTHDSISMQLTNASRVDIMLLTATVPVDSCQQVICIVRTYGLPEEFTQSVVEWYSWHWKRLDNEPLLTAEDKQRMKGCFKQSKVLNYYIEKLNKY